MDRENSKYTHLFALVRYEIPTDLASFHNSISVVKVFADREAAETEAKRLGSINSLLKCRYEVQVTRFVSKDLEAESSRDA